LTNQRDLAWAYSPGVAAAGEEIAADPASAFKYTARGNLVAVITNGTAVLGPGNIGRLASRPAMEGSGAPIKTFAGSGNRTVPIHGTSTAAERSPK
jgi:malate dehydrogenase (oxaloacetate-decarboxylating)(NADP+)